MWTRHIGIAKTTTARASSAREDFTVLAELLGKIEGKFILSLNDKPEVRELFRHSSWREVKVNYTCSNGKNLKAGELIFRNFD